MRIGQLAWIGGLALALYFGNGEIKKTTRTMMNAGAAREGKVIAQKIEKFGYKRQKELDEVSE